MIQRDPVPTISLEHIDPDEIAGIVAEQMGIGPTSPYVTHHQIIDAVRRGVEVTLARIEAGPEPPPRRRSFWALSTAEAVGVLDQDDGTDGDQVIHEISGGLQQ